VPLYDFCPWHRSRWSSRERWAKAAEQHHRTSSSRT
jgi:hypothetical protein